MTADFTMRWHVVANDIPRIKVGMMVTARQIVAKAAMDIEAGAKRRAPVDTGTLRNSIQAYQVGGNATSGSSRWRVVVGVDYGVHVEWGTVHMAAQPYLRPAVTEVAPGFLAAMRKVAA